MKIKELGQEQAKFVRKLKHLGVKLKLNYTEDYNEKKN